MQRQEKYDATTQGSTWCTPCNKMGHRSRKAARNERKDLRIGGKPAAYPCPHDTGLWHLGHLPQAVRSGEKDRAAIYHRRHRPERKDT